MSCISRAALPEAFEAFARLRPYEALLGWGKDQRMVRCLHIPSFKDYTIHAGKQIYG